MPACITRETPAQTLHITLLYERTNLDTAFDEHFLCNLRKTKWILKLNITSIMQFLFINVTRVSGCQ